MTKTRVILVVGILLIGGAYLAGFWPEHQRLAAVQSELRALEARVAELESRVRLGEVLGELLSLSDSVDAQNYGAAAARASGYFDRVAAEARGATDPAVRDVLERVDRTRDSVVAALARAEPAVRDTLREQEHAIRRALEYDVPQ